MAHLNHNVNQQQNLSQGSNTSNQYHRSNQHASFNQNVTSNPVNATITNAVNNLAQNTAQLLSQNNGLIGINSIGQSINSSNHVTNGNSSTATTPNVPPTNSVSNLNNLLLVQQLLNSSLPQLQNVANANPVALAAAVSAASNSTGKFSYLIDLTNVQGNNC